MEYNLMAVCECKITAESEGDALSILSRRIEDCVVENNGELKRLVVLKAGARIITGD
jgi:hypothetical protein